MTWIELAWTVMASASLTLAGVHLFVWFKDRSQSAHLWFFALAASVPLFSVFEILAIHAQTPDDYAYASRWAQVPLFLVIVSFVGFVRAYFDAGRDWLAWSIVVTRARTRAQLHDRSVGSARTDLGAIAHGTLGRGRLGAHRCAESLGHRAAGQQRAVARVRGGCRDRSSGTGR
ncbi:MAG: hypothetical protein IPM22_10400 [Betaproteobacteria bacterium]|nr:hypothetical protein [Betaproteobacteria bacterium]